MITNIDIDEALVAEAMKVSGARTKREVVDRALREMVARARRPRFRDFIGVGDIDPAYDPKASTPEEFGKYRVEQPRASYRHSVPPAETPPSQGKRKR
ncbi:type II toxin-antitoxin system VapB family antitoxin [Ramlibacter sp.]|uniref:type II toxin-antitoxin system VapB family antitoxin n=1 Tax=Ramlibacter sp. TaxID=1917967 RepID=UPI002FCAFD4E